LKLIPDFFAFSKDVDLWSKELGATEIQERYGYSLIQGFIDI
jgi:hypothetical protein